ncbi:MAG: hypothetical protein PWR24_975 [Desulfonauticus sp.]|nr:hypothetical protein [Desulfonauticus sp.]
MPACKRCAKCCETSPPTLHQEDKELVIQKIIARDKLLTLRQGEVVFEHSSQQYLVLKEELIKIRTENSKCIFLEQNSCSIYQNRPIECKNFFCSQPQNLLNIQYKNLLHRLDIIKRKSALGEIIQEHENICNLHKLKKYLKEKNIKKVEDALYFDFNIREYLKNKLELKDSILNFYFGRPLEKVLDLIKPFLR